MQDPSALPLEQLRARNSAISIAALLDDRGAVLAATADSDTDRDLLASFVVALTALSDRSLGELGRGALRTLLLEGDAGSVVVAPAGDDRYVAAVLTDECAIGAALSDVRACARGVREARA